jgi:copper chaperone CopZ
MKTLKFKTNVNCGGCISNVTPYLTSIKEITKWSVDTENPSKILTIESEEIPPSRIINALSAAGYKAELVGE